MKKITLTLLISIIASCADIQPKIEKKDSLALKRIKQRIEVSGMGLVKDFEVDSIQKLNDSTYFARHSFFNEMVNKEIRTSKKYHFNQGFDSITQVEDLLIEMKSEGEWMPTGW